MSFLTALRGRSRDRLNEGREGSRTHARYGPGRAVDDRQRNVRTVVGFKPILDYVDMHQRDGYPDSPLVPAGGRYMDVQMLSLRDPVDARWLNDVLDGKGLPYWLRTTKNVHETQRMAQVPAPPASAYQIIDWHQQAYKGVPEIGMGPGTVMMSIPLSQMVD